MKRKTSPKAAMGVRGNESEYDYAVRTMLNPTNRLIASMMGTRQVTTADNPGRYPWRQYTILFLGPGDCYTPATPHRNPVMSLPKDGDIWGTWAYLKITAGNTRGADGSLVETYEQAFWAPTAQEAIEMAVAWVIALGA